MRILFLTFFLSSCACMAPIYWIDGKAAGACERKRDCAKFCGSEARVKDVSYMSCECK